MSGLPKGSSADLRAEANAVVKPDPSEGDAGDPDLRRGARCMDARALG
jgi:hypothetical protein